MSWLKLAKVGHASGGGAPLVSVRVRVGGMTLIV
jgi:hypothetical protein